MIGWMVGSDVFWLLAFFFSDSAVCDGARGRHDSVDRLGLPAERRAVRAHGWMKGALAGFHKCCAGVGVADRYRRAFGLSARQGRFRFYVRFVNWETGGRAVDNFIHRRSVLY